MSLPTIAIINFSSLDDQEVQRAIRAVNRQVTEDFMPIWGAGRICKLHASPWGPGDENVLAEDPVPADSVIYLIDEGSLAWALGYHSINAREIPIGFVFVEVGDWEITLSHEVLELIIDPSVNIWVPGPHPTDQNRYLFHSYEVCDAVERFSYFIDGVEVSDFVTPAYFAEGDAPGTRNDFLGVGVSSFGVTEGSHLGVRDYFTWQWEIINGMQKKPETDLLARRAGVFDRLKTHKTVKPKRPEDEAVCKILCEYNECPPKRCKPLPHLLGVTRTLRYKAAPERARVRRSANDGYARAAAVVEVVGPARPSTVKA